MMITGRQAARIFSQWHLGDPAYADIIVALLNAEDEEEALCRLECWDIDRDTAQELNQEIN